MNNSLIPKNLSSGRALWGIHALWAIVLSRWQVKNTPKNKEPQFWPGVEFDKLVHLIHLLWNSLYEHNPKLVSFPSVYFSENGVHGPGPALREKGVGNRHIFALGAIDHIQETLKRLNPDIHLFDFNIKKYNNKKYYEVRPGRERTYLQLHLSNSLPNAFRGQDVIYVNSITELVQNLTQEEVRALGTHQNKEGTIEAIEYNVYVHLFNRFMLEVELIENPEKVKKRRRELGRADPPSMNSIIKEIGRKSQHNRTAYSSARRKIFKASEGGNYVAKVALKFFKEPGTIWVDEVSNWYKSEEYMMNLYAYLVALRNVYFPPDDPDQEDERNKLKERLQNEKRRGLEGARQIKNKFNVQLPDLTVTKKDTYPWLDLKYGIAKVFYSTSGVSKYRKEFESRVRKKFHTLT